MAHTEIEMDASGNVFFYHVASHAVGQNAANYWTDIMLVQYYIRNIYQMNREGRCSVWKMTKASENDWMDLPEPHKDFKALKKTAKWIRHFQSDATLLNGYPMLASGRLIPGIGQAFYLCTIFYESMKAIGYSDPSSWMKGDPSLPAAVKLQLKFVYVP